MFQDSASSLPLQIALYFHGFYSIALVVLTLLIYIYKTIMLPYPPGTIGLEVTFVFLYAVVEWIRIRQGWFPTACFAYALHTPPSWLALLLVVWGLSASHDRSRPPATPPHPFASSLIFLPPSPPPPYPTTQPRVATKRRASCPCFSPSFLQPPLFFSTSTTSDSKPTSCAWT